MAMLKKAGGNWVAGDRFFNREVELEALEERVRDGAHTLLTAQRRMGKTSLVRELLRHLAESGEFATIFVDLEAAADPADAVAEIAVQARPLQKTWRRITDDFANYIGNRVEELSFADTWMKLRAGIDAGNWQQRGDAVFAALAASDRPVVLAIDELPILVNALLKDADGRITPEGKQAAGHFLSWLRKNGQAHSRRIVMILTGSIGLEPLLEQAGLSAHANIYPTYDLKPWSEKTALACLDALARNYGVGLAPEVGRDMCRRLRRCIPHHVQMFFDKLHDHLRRDGRTDASLDDVETVYREDMLGARGQMDLQHYESRLQLSLGRAGYEAALELLTDIAVHRHLDDDGIEAYRERYPALEKRADAGAPSLQQVIRVLEHDGYLERHDSGLRFVSGLLEHWWRNRHGQSLARRSRRRGGRGEGQ